MRKIAERRKLVSKVNRRCRLPQGLDTPAQLAELCLELFDLRAGHFKISPLLCHPNSWVRHGAIGFFAAVSRQFGDAQVFCFVRPLLRPFLSRPLLSLDAEHLAAALRPPASRRVFDRALAAAAEQTDAAGDGAMMQGLLRAAAEPSGGQGGPDGIFLKVG